MEANSPRPLEQALAALQQKYGWIVDYEDPRYVSQSDIVEMPGDVAHAHVPAGRSFSVDFPATEPEEAQTLRLVVDAYNSSQNPGKFELRRNATGDFYVVGTAAHDDKGAMAEQKAVLDLPVTLATKERTILETINLICHALEKQSHTKVIVGVYPESMLSHTLVKIGGAKMPARDLLLQALLGASRSTYWRLHFDPDSKQYFLDIHSYGPSHSSPPK